MKDRIPKETVQEIREKRLSEALVDAARAAEVFHALLLGYEITLPSNGPGEPEYVFCLSAIWTYTYYRSSPSFELCRICHHGDKTVLYVVEAENIMSSLIKLCRDFRIYDTQRTPPSRFIKSKHARPIWLSE